ncbi:MAG: glycosyltransferase [Methanosarcinaceae archaeon]
MKILLISNMYPRGGNFSGIFIKRQIESIEKLGVQVTKVVKRRKSPLGYFPFIFHSIYKLLFCNYDVIHAHYVPHSALIPAAMKWIKKKPLIITFHGTDARIFPWKNRINRMLTMFVVNRSDRIIARSEEMKSVLEKLGCPGKKIVVISAGVDTRLFHPIDKNKARADIGLPVDKHIVLYVGRLHEMKGVNDIYACAERMSEILFVMVGDGAIKTDVGNCIFAGAKKYDEIPVWMSAADILVLPSYSEGLPNVVMEALSCGTPAIVTDVGGCPEVVSDGETGFVVPVGDVEALMDKIEYLLDNEDLRERMGKLGRVDMVGRYDREKVIGKLKEVYESLYYQQYTRT